VGQGTKARPDAGPILFCFACLYLATAGGRPISVDAMMGKKNSTVDFTRRSRAVR
jgi:hypothetical protein